MSDFYASVNGLRVTGGNVSIPYYGIPVADIAMAGSDALPTAGGAVTLAIGNLTLKMTVLRQRAFAGSTTARLVGGAGGWGKQVPAHAYQDPNGVPLASVLRDVALTVGETVALASPRSVGAFYAREAGPAERVLRQLAGKLWWIDVGGVTQVATRTATKIKTPATVEALHGAEGWLTVATEDPAAWLPAATYAGSTVPDGLTVSATRITFQSDGKARLEVLTVDSVIAQGLVTPDNVTAADRTMAALRVILRSEDPGRVPGGGPWEYQIERADASTFDGSPTSQDFPLPPLVGVPYRPALAGTSCVPVKGCLAYVDFINRDPTRPILRGFGTTLPTVVTVDATTFLDLGPSTDVVDLGQSASAVEIAGGNQPVARKTDHCGRLIFDSLNKLLYYSPGASGVPYVLVADNPNASTPAPPSPSDTGTNVVITTGSAKVSSG